MNTSKYLQAIRKQRLIVRRKSIQVMPQKLLTFLLVLSLMMMTISDVFADEPTVADPAADVEAAEAYSVFLPVIAGGQGDGVSVQSPQETMSTAEIVLGEEPQVKASEKPAGVQDNVSQGQVPPAPGLEPLLMESADVKANVPEKEGFVAPAAVDGWTTIMSEGFEGAFPSAGWRAMDNDGSTNGEYYWDDENYMAYSGAWSAWAANGGINALEPLYYNYPNNMRSWMIYGPFDLSNASDANLLFYYWNRSEANYDYFQWLASVNGTNFYGYQVSGDSSGWRNVNFDLKAVPTLGNLTGKSSVWIAFYFGSDYSVTDKGPFVDNVTLQKLVGTAPTCTKGKEVGRDFWFDVNMRLSVNGPSEVRTEYPINDFSFAIEALSRWAKYENTDACWNPIATTWDTGSGTWTCLPGNTNNPCVKSYNDRSRGVQGTTATISKFNTANPDTSYIRKMLARNSFNEAGLRNALNAYSHNGAYVTNLLNEWKSLYNNWKTTPIRSKNSQKCMDVNGAARDNGIQIIQWDCHGGNNQQWRLNNLNNGYYQIISANSGRCLDVKDWSTSNGARIQQWDCHGGNNQQWQLVSSGSYYKLISRHSGKCIDVKDVSTSNGAILQQWACYGGNNQLWSLTLP